jgi:hypothetical protein
MGAIQVKALSTQGTRSRLARGPARTGFTVKQPWPDRLANQSYRRSIQCKDRLTPYPDARSSVARAKVTAVTSPLHWLTWQENSVACPAPTAVPPARVRLTAAESSLRRHRKLRLARPRCSAPASTSEDGLCLARSQGSAPASTSEDGLRLARPQGSAPASTSEDGLRLARPQGSASTSTSEESPPRPTLGSDRLRYSGVHHYPTPS